MNESEMTMLFTIKTILRSSLLLSLGLAGSTGCANGTQEAADDFFPSADKYPQARQIIDIQVANGAREDATLQPFHFDGAKLNSLGEEKLALLVADEDEVEDADVVVYMNLPAGNLTNTRRDAVTAYLKAAGVESSHLKIASGPNPHLTTPSAIGLAAMSKTDTAPAAASSAADGTTPAPAATTGNK